MSNELSVVIGPIEHVRPGLHKTYQFLQLFLGPLVFEHKTANCRGSWL